MTPLLTISWALPLAGAILQTGILHYRGAFNTPLMYAPFTLPPFAALGSAWLERGA